MCKPGGFTAGIDYLPEHRDHRSAESFQESLSRVIHGFDSVQLFPPELRGAVTNIDITATVASVAMTNLVFLFSEKEVLVSFSKVIEKLPPKVCSSIPSLQT